ncbi:MAG: hypothetical protein ACRDGV_02830 [Candidatus Limnocylindria bacterium]
MAGLIWVTDREPGIRALFAELLHDAEVLDPEELRTRLDLGQRPDALVIDGTQLLELPAHLTDELMRLPRLLVCTGLSLTGLPPSLVAGGPGVAILAKPFCVEDLESALEWLSGVPSPIPVDAFTASSDSPGGRGSSRLPMGVLVQRRRPRRPRGTLPPH